MSCLPVCTSDNFEAISVWEPLPLSASGVKGKPGKLCWHGGGGRGGGGKGKERGGEVR